MIRPTAVLLSLTVGALAQDMPTMVITPSGRTLTARGIAAMDRYDDITAARLLLKPAADRGDADAARRIADTFDPVWLAKRHVIGAGLADPEKAWIWYRRAAELGDTRDGNRFVVGIGK